MVIATSHRGWLWEVSLHLETDGGAQRIEIKFLTVLEATEGVGGLVSPETSLLGF